MDLRILAGTRSLPIFREEITKTVARDGITACRIQSRKEPGPRRKTRNWWKLSRSMARVGVVLLPLLALETGISVGNGGMTAWIRGSTRVLGQQKR